MLTCYFKFASIGNAYFWKREVLMQFCW